MVSGCAQLQTLVNGQTVSETVTQQYSASTSPNIVLNTSNGSIDVSASDSNTVKIEAEKRAQSAADLKQVNVSFSSDNSGVRAEYRPASDSGPRSPRVNFKVTAPKGAILQLQSGNGSIDTDGFTGDVTANSGNGSATIKNQDGPVNLMAGNGSITAQGLLKGSSSATAGNGSITVELPGDSQLHINAATTNGSITTQFGLSVQGSNVARVDANLGNGSDGTLKLQAGNGSIAINKH
jgi:DUF4097 and DUF4098 domain-containing protein YvlB